MAVINKNSYRVLSYRSKKKKLGRGPGGEDLPPNVYTELNVGRALPWVGSGRVGLGWVTKFSVLGGSD